MALPDHELLQWLSAHLVRLGPGLLFVVCLLETAVFAGLVLPVGALIAFAAALSAAGVFEPTDVVLVALAGALCGDQLGFAVGRWFLSGARPRKGRVAQVWRNALGAAERLVLRRGLLGVTAARAIPFVRTIMPWFAGRSGMAWWRFALFDLLGVLLWGVIYLGGGFTAGAGWRRVAGTWGETIGGVAIAVVLLGALLLTRRWIRAFLDWRSRARATPEG